MPVYRCYLWASLILRPLVSYLESKGKDEYREEPPEWGDEDQINAYVDRLKDIEIDSLNNISQTVLKFSPWGIGLSLTYIKLIIPDVELTFSSWIFLIAAWTLWVTSFGGILLSFLFSGFFSWFNESVGLYRRYIAGMFWDYREKFYMMVGFSLFLFILGFGSIIIFAILSASTATTSPTPQSTT